MTRPSGQTGAGMASGVGGGHRGFEVRVVLICFEEMTKWEGDRFDFCCCAVTVHFGTFLCRVCKLTS